MYNLIYITISCVILRALSYVTIPNVDGAEPMIMRQHVLDEEVKENQRREAVIWKLETVLRRRKAKLAKIRSELGPAVCYYS